MRKYLVFSIAVVPTFLGSVGSTAVAVAFPTMVAHYQNSLVLAGWIVGIYPLVAIAAVPIMSRLSDTVGRRSTFMLCLLLFVLGSLLCAIAPNMGWLIFFRAIQATGGGGFTSASVGIISDEFGAKRPQFIALMSSTIHFGAIVGPNIGGVMVQYLGWQSIFWLNVPTGIIALVLCLLYIRADIRKASHGEMDFLGVGLLAGFTSAIMVSLTLMGKDYHVPPSIIAAIALSGFLLLATFVYRSAKTPSAFVDRKMLTSRPFLAANAFNFLYGSCTLGGAFALVPLYAASVYNMGVFESGLMITPRSFGVVCVSIVASFFLMRWGYRRPMLVGTSAVILGMTLLALEPQEVSLLGIRVTPLALLLIIGLVLGIGSGMVNPASNNACIELMPEKAATITGFRQVFRQMGGAIGIAVSTLIIESSSSIARGFTIVFLVFGALQLLSLILIFYMPASPVVRRLRSERDTQAPKASRAAL